MSFKSFISIRPCWPLTAYIAPPSDAFSLNLVKWPKLMDHSAHRLEKITEKFL